MTHVFHDDNPTKAGNMTAEEYEATYNDEGTKPGHEIPTDVLNHALFELGEMQ